MVMVIDKPSTRARRVCSICLSGSSLLLALGLGPSCKDAGTGSAPASGAAGAPRAAPPSEGRPSGASPSATGGSESGATARAARPPVPRLSAETPELLVPSCSPCAFAAAPGIEYEIEFQAPANGAELRQIQIEPARGNSSPSAPRATLAIEDGFTPTGNFMLRALDLNFDGVLDLGFGPVLGTPNLTLSYWLHDAAGSGWKSLGMLSNVKVDPAAREVVTSEKGGHAGMLWQENAFHWQGGELMLVRSVKQEEAPGKRGYRRVTRTFQAGKQIGEKTEAVQAPAGTD